MLFGIDFGDDCAEFLADELAQIFDAIQRTLAGRNEAAQMAHFALQATFVLAGDAGFDHHSLAHLRPVFHGDGSAGKDQFVQAFGRIEPGDLHFENGAGLRAARQTTASASTPCRREPRSRKTLSR